MKFCVAAIFAIVSLSPFWILNTRADTIDIEESNSKFAQLINHKYTYHAGIGGSALVSGNIGASARQEAILRQQLYINGAAFGLNQWHAGVLASNSLSSNTNFWNYAGVSLVRKFYFSSQYALTPYNVPHGVSYFDFIGALVTLLPGVHQVITAYSVGPQIGLQNGKVMVGVGTEAEIFLGGIGSTYYSLPIRMDLNSNFYEVYISYSAGLRVHF